VGQFPVYPFAATPPVRPQAVKGINGGKHKANLLSCPHHGPATRSGGIRSPADPRGADRPPAAVVAAQPVSLWRTRTGQRAKRAGSNVISAAASRQNRQQKGFGK
jgi:hypothetical protein